MNNHNIVIRNALNFEFEEIGKLMINVYSQLDGFPSELDQPIYYNMLKNIGDLTLKPKTELLAAANNNNSILGAVVYFGDMAYYGSGGTASKELESAGFRLLAVDKSARGLGIGKLLSIVCINKAKEQQCKKLVIHTTKYMQAAWIMYEKLGFKRAEDLDFKQGDLDVFGFKLIF
jgi:GNAT superfamily N-acetyltransferase